MNVLIKEAREKLKALARSIVATEAEVMTAADVYGDARELEGHVEACGWRTGDPETGYSKCGEGVYCDEGKRLQGGNA